jgi:hypothetical protein
MYLFLFLNLTKALFGQLNVLICDKGRIIVEDFALLMHSCHAISINLLSSFTDEERKCERTGPSKCVKGSA